MRARATGERGVPVSASAPSFMPYHVTGPNAGGKACPLCTYGLGPHFQFWMEESRLISASYDLSDSQIAPKWEPGQRLIVRFRVVDTKGRPLAKTKVGTHQTDRTGHYNPQGWNRRPPRLSTVAWTDDDGWITFDTVMPGPYPGGGEPAHIHFSASINGKAEFRTLWFEGDPLLTEERRRWADRDEETLVIPLDRGSNPWQAEHVFVIRTQ